MIADDHAVVRRGLQQIAATRPGWSIAAEAPSADDVLPALRKNRIDVLILDISMGGRSGIDLLSNIHAEFPALPVLMFSMHAEEQYAIRALRAGAQGYVQKDSTPEEIVTAIERVASGHRYMTEAVAEKLAGDFLEGRSAEPHERLSDREFEVFRQIAAGRRMSEIAENLHLSIKTVSTYRTRILEKTGFRSNADIIHYAVRAGLV
jgi:DNA-binding NarL/FixJ family response regulator